jgi:benzoyl-CoA 2,3-dioxygenase component B
MSDVNYQDKIPNNVDLHQDRRLQRALEEWLPNYLDWWMEMGPEGFQRDDIYLRTAVSVDADGWAKFGHVKMPDYRWGIFLNPKDPNRTIHFGDHIGEAAWEQVPGEHRTALRRLIVTQGDTEPASVEQQRLLGQVCPSLYDLRNLFQVNVEEGRHLWAMVYLLHTYFGRDGREEAEAMLERRSGNADHPRILGAFNAPIDDWMSFFCFTTFTDRDGKYQLRALAESGFDPLARTTQFMLTEEAHHMFVGQTGVARILKRTAEMMKNRGGDVRGQGGIPLEMIQKWVNLWYSLSVDLFGGEDSSNAALFFGSSLKGRDREAELTEHTGLHETYKLTRFDANGRESVDEIPLRRAMNEVLRDAYIEDCEKVVKSWNRTLADEGCESRLFLPSRRFHRAQGIYSEGRFDANGRFLSDAEWEDRKGEWLPTQEDQAYVKSLMYAVTKPGEFAHWIAPPARGINNQSVEFEYAKFDTSSFHAPRT